MDVAACSKRSPLEHELTDLSSHFYLLSPLSQKRHLAWNLHRLLEQQSYEIVHSHLHGLNGVVGLVARFHRVPIVISHSHGHTHPLGGSVRWSRRWVDRGLRVLDLALADGQLGCSSAAAADLFSSRTNPRVIYCGIDARAFSPRESGAARRLELGIPRNALVIGHVGAHHPAKNHAFLAEVANEVLNREPNAHFLIVGDERNAEAFANRPSLARTHVLGVRRDISDLLSCMDVFVFPSVSEGMPIVLMEAQAAGLPCVYSDVVPKEIEVKSDLMHRLSLRAGAGKWADVAVEVGRRSAHRPRRGAIQGSRFDIEVSCAALLDYYRALLEVKTKCPPLPSPMT